MIPLVGLTGAAGCGKDTLADALKSIYYYEKYSFAGPIKEAICAMFSDYTLFDRDNKESPLAWINASPRSLAQTLGTEWGREMIDKDIWIKLANRFWNRLRERKDSYDVPVRMVIPDVRFENEARWIKAAGGVVVKVTRPGNDLSVPEHKSEAGIPGLLVDGTVLNLEGHLEDAYNQLMKIIRR